MTRFDSTNLPTEIDSSSSKSSIEVYTLKHVQSRLMVINAMNGGFN